MKPNTGRQQSIGEEIANAISHGFGFVAAALGLPVLIVSALDRGDAMDVVAASVFAGSLMLLYLVSTVYHALPQNRAKKIFQILDHAAIFVLIAGTYTPFTLGVLRGAWGWSLFGVVWTIAVVGIVMKVVVGVNYPKVSIALYLGMGWLAIVAVKPTLTLLPASGIAWVAAGGLIYTAGVPFYLMDNRRYLHFVWHLFVLGGSLCHFVAVWFYA
ncbi:MAG: hemolysin III family protein [Bacteroidetes bacterium]|nr:hemolysin III family protein [Bacteroidota bacterium]